VPLNDSPATTEQVEDQDYRGNHKQQVNQPAAYAADKA
jgi:hypothetical protein